MPRRTAKPALSVTSVGSEWVLTVYKVSNMKRIRHATLTVPAGDREAMLAALEPIYAKLRAKPAT